MRRALLGTLLTGVICTAGVAVPGASAQGVYIGPGGIGVDPGPRYRDDRETYGYRRRDRDRYRERDDDDYRPRRRRHRDYDDDQ